MIEGPGHVPCTRSRPTWTSSLECGEAPFYTSWDRSSPTSRRYDHITQAWRRHDRLVRHGDALLRHAQGASRPADRDDDEGGRHHRKIAAHAADLAKGHPRRAATTPCPRRASTSAGSTSSTRPIRRRRRSSMTRRCPRRRTRRRTSARCVRAEVLLHAHHPGHPRLRQEGHGRDERQVPKPAATNSTSPTSRYLMAASRYQTATKPPIRVAK